MDPSISMLLGVTAVSFRGDKVAVSLFAALFYYTHDGFLSVCGEDVMARGAKTSFARLVMGTLRKSVLLRNPLLIRVGIGKTMALKVYVGKAGCR